jgi:hypothetical protein
VPINCGTREAQIGRRPVLLVERGGLRRRVRVSAKQTGDWQTSIEYGAEVASPELRDRTWVLVDVGASEPEFFVVPEDWMVQNIYETHQRFLARHAGKPVTSSPHHAIRPRQVEQWRDRWDVVDRDGDVS